MSINQAWQHIKTKATILFKSKHQRKKQQTTNNPNRPFVFATKLVHLLMKTHVPPAIMLNPVMAMSSCKGMSSWRPNGITMINFFYAHSFITSYQLTPLQLIWAHPFSPITQWCWIMAFHTSTTLKVVLSEAIPGQSRASKIILACFSSLSNALFWRIKSKRWP